MMSKTLSRKVELIAALQETLQRSIDAGVPGLTAAIHSSRGALWQSTAGLSDVIAQNPIDSSHHFGVGSITKVFVAVVILQLVEEKKLRLSDRLGEILDPKVLYGIENAHLATIEGLLSHTAGIESWEDDPIWIIQGRGKDLDPVKIWSKTSTLDYIRRPNPSGPKQGQWSYSNTNYTFLGLVIEKITQETAESEIRRRILEPLDMKTTSLEGFEESSPGQNLPRRYHWATEVFRKNAGICPAFSEPRDGLIDATGSNLSVEWTAGGIVSSPSELLTFAIALRDGKLLSSETLEEMKQWRLTDRSDKVAIEMGLGIFRIQSPLGCGRWLGHNGSVLGFTGGLWWKEDGDCAIAISANVGTMHAGEVPSSVDDIIFKTEFLKLALELADCD